MKKFGIILTLLFVTNIYCQMSKKDLLDYALSKDWIIFNKKSATHFIFSFTNSSKKYNEFIDVKFNGHTDNSDVIGIRFVGFSEKESVVWNQLSFSHAQKNMIIQETYNNEFIGSTGYKVLQKPYFNSRSNRYMGIRAYMRYKTLTFD